jgi:hypothetical protein
MISVLSVFLFSNLLIQFRTYNPMDVHCMAKITGVGKFFAEHTYDIVSYLARWRVCPRTCTIQRKHLLEHYHNSLLLQFSTEVVNR